MATSPLTGRDIEQLLRGWNRGSPCAKTGPARQALTQMKEERDVLLAWLAGQPLERTQAETLGRLQAEADRVWG